nr:rho GTPase-activating protein 22-like [Oncorhynchus nerka]
MGQDCCKLHKPQMVYTVGGSGKKDSSGLSESFLLMANSQRDMEEWVRAIRRAIWAPLGGGIFGQHLEETMQCESGCGSSSKTVVPLLVHQCVCFIHQHGLTEEGLFRIPGQTNHVQELQDAFDCGEKPLFDSNTDVHTVASLLKLYLRELPEPVVPFNKYTEFLFTAQLLTKDKEEGIFELGRQVRTLPQVNYNLLKYICRFLDEVQSHSSQNKMSVQNLAAVFGSNILRPKMEDAQTMMEGSSQVQHLMTILISEHSRLYQGEAETPREDQFAPAPTRYPQAPPIHQCMVEWLSQQSPTNPTQPYPSLGQTPNTPCQEPLQPIPTSNGSSLNTDHPGSTTQGRKEGYSEGKSDGRTEGKMERKSEGKNERTLSGGSGAALGPSKQSKSLSSWRSSLKGGSGSIWVRGKIGGSAVDMSTVTWGNWRMNGLSPFHSHRRTTLTGKRLKESSLSLTETHKDSLPDSYTGSSLSIKYSSHSQTSLLKDSSPLHIDSSSSSIDSSFPNIKTSISVKNSFHSNRLSTYDNVTINSCSLSLPGGSPSPWASYEISLAESTETDRTTLNSGLGSGKAVAGSSVAGSSNSALELCVSSAGCSKGDPGDDITGLRPGVNEGLFSLVTDLKEELRRQRFSYETQIRKLEESCSGLCLQSGRLEEDLNQEKKRFRMLEIRLGNSKRARHDAETLNVLLQKEKKFWET